MSSPAEPGRAEAPWNLSKTSLIIIINQPPPPLALPWSIWGCSHHLANSILIDFAFFGSQIRPPVQKLRTIENWSEVHLKLYFGRISCISKVYFCISDHLWRPGSVCWFKMSHWKVNLEIWVQSCGRGECFDTYIANCIWVVFGLYFLYFRTVFLYVWPHGWFGLDLNFPKITSESQIGGPSQKLWTFKVKQKVNVFLF